MYYSLLIICHCPFTYYMLHFLTTRIIYICNIATMALRAKLLRKHCWQFCLCIAMCSKSVNSENVIISRHWAERRVDIWLFDIQMPFHIWICIFCICLHCHFHAHVLVVWISVYTYEEFISRYGWRSSSHCVLFTCLYLSFCVKFA